MPKIKKITLLTFLEFLGKFKDHKNLPKFRPIFNKKGPTYDLGKCMADIYKKFSPLPHVV